jgi:hypothetical protein
MNERLILLFLSTLLAACYGQTKNSALGHLDLSANFSFDLPQTSTGFPDKSADPAPVKGFILRGTKGWAWSPEQYLAEIPYLQKFRMNFLMNCYLSMFTDPEKLINRWWKPLPETKKRAYEQVVQSCREHGITFCFAFHPQLFSKRPLRYDNAQDFASLWQHYAWMQGLGVNWFSVSYDDITVKGENIGQLGEKHARLVNKLLARLRKNNPNAQMIFCPTFYWGPGDSGDAKTYLTALGEILDKDAFIFWTGDAVYTPAITQKCANSYKNVVKHRLIIWDNYPVNDRTGALHLGPIIGRDKELSAIAYGYMSNPLAPQNEINRIPLFTCADYAFNPGDYDPMRSIGQAVFYLGKTPGQRQVLHDLVELYPGPLIYGRNRSSTIWVLEKLGKIMQGPEAKMKGLSFIDHVQNALDRLDREFPGQYRNTRETIRLHIEKMKELIQSAKAGDDSLHTDTR